MLNSEDFSSRRALLSFFCRLLFLRELFVLYRTGTLVGPHEARNCWLKNTKNILIGVKQCRVGQKTMTLSEQLTGAYPANQGCVHCVCQIAKANVRHGHHHWSVGKSYTHVNSGPVHPVRPMLQPLALGKALDKTPDEIFAGW